MYHIERPFVLPHLASGGPHFQNWPPQDKLPIIGFRMASTNNAINEFIHPNKEKESSPITDSNPNTWIKLHVFLVIQNDETSFSVDEYAYFNKKIPAMASFTICYWEFIKYFSQKTTISPFAFCHQGPSSKDRMKCLQMFLKPDITSMGSKVRTFVSNQSIKLLF